MHAQAVTPILNVSYIKQSFEWFEKLGWIKRWDWGEPPVFGSVASANFEIFLCVDSQGSRGKGNNKSTFGEEGGENADKGVWMTIYVADVDQIHQHCISEGLEVMYGPEDMPWGVREVHLRHPDGHVFRITQTL